MAMEKSEANLFFQMVNSLYGQSSLIITSNKGPAEWGELIGEPAITTAILDRILHKCEVVDLKEDSWRINHRASIFGKC
jgi:DNA replication protein DnaC